MSLLKPITCDFLIIGAGIIGVTIALALRNQSPTAKIIILEKESEPGLHASGRNSGVLHAGFYYTKESLKAKFSKIGNLALTQYCLERKLPINTCGKLVVARNAEDLPGLYGLLRRGKENDIKLSLMTAQEAREVEPRVKTHEYALFSPTTSSVDPKAIMTERVKELIQAKIELRCNELFLSQKNHIIKTNRDDYAPFYVINASGLYADRIAKQFGFANRYEILPFKGLYLYGSPQAEKLRTHIYPVPNLKNPFLGVHFTVTVKGEIKMGPTAIPALWREHYEGLKNFKFSEASEILWRQLSLLLYANFDFRKLAFSELRKYNRRILVNHASELAHNIKQNDFLHWGKPGIRAQLIDLKNKKLEMDFVVEHDDRSLHILNAVSPAFTCSIPFAEEIVKVAC